MPMLSPCLVVPAGCDELIASMFDLCHSLCSLNLSEYEIAFFCALILLDPSRPWLQDKQKVETLHRKLELSFRHLLRRTHREAILSKVRPAVCSIHFNIIITWRRHPHITLLRGISRRRGGCLPYASCTWRS
ncbi:hypothetical protein FKM82_028360 [Ascaphus truei]